MAWRDRLRGITNRIGRALRGTGGAQPPAAQPPPRPAPRPQPQRTYPVPSRYSLPSLPQPTQPIQPDDSGLWAIEDDVPLDTQEDLPWGAYEPVYDDQLLYGGEPDDWITLYDRNSLPIEYNKVTGEPIHYSADQWFRESLRSKDELLAEYGTDNLSIVRYLYDQGYIDRDDWDTWRELYDSMYG